MTKLEEAIKRLPSLEDSWKREIARMIESVRKGQAVAKFNGFDLSSELTSLVGAVDPSGGSEGKTSTRVKSSSCESCERLRTAVSALATELEAISDRPDAFDPYQLETANRIVAVAARLRAAIGEP